MRAPDTLGDHRTCLRVVLPPSILVGQGRWLIHPPFWFMVGWGLLLGVGVALPSINEV